MVRVKHGGKKFPRLVLRDFAFGLVPSHLLIERVEKLLTGGGPGESCAVVERAAETAEIKYSLGSAIEGHAHAVEQVNNARRSLAHGLDRRLVAEKVAAVNRVVEVLPGRVAFAFQVLGGIDSALSANRVRALDRHDGEQVHVPAHFGDLDSCGKSSESATDHDDFWISCHLDELFTTETRSHGENYIILCLLRVSVPPW